MGGVGETPTPSSIRAMSFSPTLRLLVLPSPKAPGSHLGLPLGLQGKLYCMIIPRIWRWMSSQPRVWFCLSPSAEVTGGRTAPAVSLISPSSFITESTQLRLLAVLGCDQPLVLQCQLLRVSPFLLESPNRPAPPFVREGGRHSACQGR